MTPNEARIRRWQRHWDRKWRARYVLGIVSMLVLSGASGAMAFCFGFWTTIVSTGLLMTVVFGSMRRAFTRQDRREDFDMLSGREPPR